MFFGKGKRYQKQGPSYLRNVLLLIAGIAIGYFSTTLRRKGGIGGEDQSNDIQDIPVVDTATSVLSQLEEIHNELAAAHSQIADIGKLVKSGSSSSSSSKQLSIPGLGSSVSGTSKVGELGRKVAALSMNNEPFRVVLVDLNDLRKESPSPSPLPFFMIEQNDGLSDAILKFLVQHEKHVMDIFTRTLESNPCYPGLTATKQPACFHQVFKSEITPDTEVIVLDIGANHHFFSLYSAAYGYKVHSFDPQPHCSLYGRVAGVLSGFDNQIVYYNAFVGKDSSRVVDVSPRTGCWGTFPYEAAFREERVAASFTDPKVKIPVPVPTVVVDELFPASKYIVALMKVDVEGHEVDVFDGAKKLIEAKRVKNIIVEFNKSQWSRAKIERSEVIRVINWLLSLGYLMKPSNYGYFFHQQPFDVSRIESMFEEGWLTIDCYFYLPGSN